MRGDGRKDGSRKKEEQGKRDEDEWQEGVDDPVGRRESRERSVQAFLKAGGASDAEESKQKEGRRERRGGSFLLHLSRRSTQLVFEASSYVDTVPDEFIRRTVEQSHSQSLKDEGCAGWREHKRAPISKEGQFES